MASISHSQSIGGSPPRRRFDFIVLSIYPLAVAVLFGRLLWKYGDTMPDLSAIAAGAMILVLPVVVVKCFGTNRWIESRINQASTPSEIELLGALKRSVHNTLLMTASLGMLFVWGLDYAVKSH